MSRTLTLANSGAVVPSTGSPDYGGGATDFAQVCLALGLIDAALTGSIPLYGADTGAANAYAVAIIPAPTLAAGSRFLFKAAHANTGASTLAINGGTAIAITNSSGGNSALIGAEIGAGQLCLVVYDGTQFQLVGSVNPAYTAAQIQNSTWEYAVDTGAANAYAAALTPAPAALVAGLSFQFKAVHANTGASTLAVNGLAAKAITKTGATALAGGEINANQIVLVTYDGAQFQLVSQ
jgi:hypothetical protein